MKRNKKSFWAKLTGLSEEELEREDWLGKKSKRKKKEDKGKEIDKFLKEKEEEIQKDEKKEDFWAIEKEGQLAVDVYQTDEAIIIKSAIAGVNQEDLDIAISEDIITIRGERRDKEEEKIDEENFFFRECYWGKFSRSIILPCKIDQSKAEAKLKNGVLTIILPKLKHPDSVRLKIKEKNSS